MTTKYFIKQMDKLGYYVENLEPSELNVVSKDPKTYDSTGWSPELIDIDTDYPFSFGIEYHVPTKVLKLAYQYSRTPIKSRKLNQAEKEHDL